jgi:hypothetical protein
MFIVSDAESYAALHFGYYGVCLKSLSGSTTFLGPALDKFATQQFKCLSMIVIPSEKKNGWFCYQCFVFEFLR